MKVSIIIPAYNEEEGISATLKTFPVKALKRAGYEVEMLVIDNNSSDNTAEIARKHGARVIHEPNQGKGYAIRTGFYSISDDTDYIVMLDGDDTYKSREILRLLEPLNSGFCDVIIGSRLTGKMKPGSMRALNRIGNWIFSFLVRVIYNVNVTDALTGYFAWRREVIEKLRPHLHSHGFAIEMEMITKMAALGFDIYSVPITYETRQGESSLNPIRDGYKILRMLIANIRWAPKDIETLKVSTEEDRE